VHTLRQSITCVCLIAALTIAVLWIHGRYFDDAWLYKGESHNLWLFSGNGQLMIEWSSWPSWRASGWAFGDRSRDRFYLASLDYTGGTTAREVGLPNWFLIALLLAYPLAQLLVRWRPTRRRGFAVQT
jgi:hypothetical protein